VSIKIPIVVQTRKYLIAYFFVAAALYSPKQAFAFGYHAINAEIEAPGRI
jgi:hypothetical protein